MGAADAPARGSDPDEVAPSSRRVAAPEPGRGVAPGDLSVVICAYTMDRWGQIVDAIASVHEQRPPVREVILVSDHNPELHRRALSELSGVQVVENADVRGLSGARNSGVRAATGRAIAFLDDDAVAEGGWAAGLSAGYADASVLAVGGASEPEWVAGRPDWFPEEFDWVVGCSYRGMPTRPSPVRNMIGSSMSFRREVFDSVGTFDPSVGRIGANPVGCEETELCIRATRHWPGSSVLYVPHARVRHRVPPERGTWRYFRSRCFAEGRSKARVTRLAGAGSGLSSERRYTVRVLPRGILAGAATALRERRVAPLGKAAAILAGLGITTAGYVVGMVENRGSPVSRPRSGSSGSQARAEGR
jgi:glucosyl-dolichyl phosphate glucuronosyltransferase